MKSKDSFKGPSLTTFTLPTSAPPLKSSPASNGATCWQPSLQHRAFEEMLTPSSGTYCPRKCLAQLLLICMSTSVYLHILSSCLASSPFWNVLSSLLFPMQKPPPKTFSNWVLSNHKTGKEERLRKWGFGCYVPNSPSSESQGHLRD